MHSSCACRQPRPLPSPPLGTQLSSAHSCALSDHLTEPLCLDFLPFLLGAVETALYPVNVSLTCRLPVSSVFILYRTLFLTLSPAGHY